MTWQKTLEEMLSRTIGLDSSSLGPTLLLRAVQRRMRALDLAREPDYVARLQRGTDELQELIEELVVSESWFFRDSQPFFLLRHHAGDWLNAPSSPLFRCLSLACATGDEPYSVAITLLDVGLSREQFEIDAVDISARALERARRGVYGSRALRVVEPRLKTRFFRTHPDGVEVAPEVRQTVRFTRGNLVEPETLMVRPSYQIIFCRNLLIYLTDAARERAVQTLDRLLGPTGLLFVGHAERLPLLEARFAPVKFRGSFAYQRQPSPNDTLPPVGTNRLAPVAKPALFAPWQPPPAPGRETTANGPLDRVVPTIAPHNHEARPQSLPPAASAQSDLIERATDLANRHDYEQALQLCEQCIRLRGPSAPAFYLLGMIRHALGDHVQAEQFLSKALYLDHQHEEALLALTLIARRRGDHAAATNYQRRAERARQRKMS